MSAELLIALAALLSWLVVGVVMFDFVEYKAVPGRLQKCVYMFLENHQTCIITNMSVVPLRYSANHYEPCAICKRRC